jgi:SlyX protein
MTTEISWRIEMNEFADRLMELEIRYAHQNRQVEELNEELTESNRRIALLEREVRAFREMLKSMAPDLKVSPDE